MRLFIMTLGFGLWLNGCGGSNFGDFSDSDSSQPTPDQDSESVEASLNLLGVDTSDEPRLDEHGTPLPDDHSPLGASMTVGQNQELFLIGPRLAVEDPSGEREVLEARATLMELSDDDSRAVELSIADLLSPATSWETDQHSFHPSSGGAGSQSVRAATAGDVDGDGVDELVVVYLDPDADPDSEATIYLEFVDHDSSDGSSSDSSARFPLLERSHVRDLALEAGDYNGDGRSDLALGITTDNAAELLVVYRTDTGELRFDENMTQEFEGSFAAPTLSLELSSGNTDRDTPQELAVVFNEYNSSERVGRAYIYLYDDAQRGFAPLLSDYRLEVADDEGDWRAMSADVSLGDVDGDGKDEVLLAGLAEFWTDACVSYQHVYSVLDDSAAPDGALRPIAQMTDRFPYIASGTGCNSNSHTLRMRHVHVNAIDVDGNGIDEFQANLDIFALSSDPTALTLERVYRIPENEFMRTGYTIGGTFSTATTDMTVADVNGDGREDLVSYVQWRSAMSVWGLDGPGLETAVWSQLIEVPTEFYNGQARVFPVLVSANIDQDGLVLQYSEGEHHFVFTEPIIIAALAAAPCARNIGQNTGACVTTYGTSESVSGGLDGTITVSASTFISGDVNIFGFGATAREEVTTTASFSGGLGYTLEETIEYTTGPLEDTVVFTTVPLDQYVYTVQAHPDPDMVGEQIVVNVPRGPITLQVEREFYNRSTADGALRVDSSVFMHTPGDIWSYPTSGDAEALIDTGGLGRTGPGGELVDAAGQALGPIAEHLLGHGLMAGRDTTVGQGTGQTSTEIRFSSDRSYRAGLSVDYRAEAGVTGGGVTVGMSVGGGVEAGVSWGSSNTTVYRGSVGSIDGQHFSENVYNFGIFTYIYNYGDTSRPQFEVINYWVD